MDVDTARRAARMPLLYRNVLTAYSNRVRPYRESDRTVVYRLRNGLSLRAAPGPHDVKIINEIWLDADYGAPGFRPQNGWTIIDLGANKGYFASWALSQAPMCRVVCFEPDPRNFDALRANLEPFQDRSRTEQAAVGATRRTLSLYRVAGRAGQASLSRARAESRGRIAARISVPVWPAAEILDEAGDVDLLKVDVEGAEYDILMDSPPEAFRRVRRVALEADAVDPSDPGRRVDDLLRHLAGLGLAERCRRRTVRFLRRDAA